MIPASAQDLARLERELVESFSEADAKGPDASKIASLHRGHDGYITFHSAFNEDGKPSDKVHHTCSIRADALEGMFPAIANSLTENAYFSINAFAAPNKEKGNAFTKSPAVYKSTMARYLCATHVDIDCYNRGMTVGQAIGQVIDAQRAKKIPSPSVYAYSGRGVWLFWFLVDQENPALPPRAGDSNILLWKAIERKILKVFVASGSDSNAARTTQITRIPGSVNTKSGEAVTWLIAGDGSRAYTYTLRELADWFGVGKVDEEYEKASRKIPNNARGHEALAKWRLKQFEFLRQMRGGFEQGRRNSAVFIYANILKMHKLSMPELIDAVEKLASECHPSFLLDDKGRPSDQATRTAVQIAGRKRAFKLKNEFISNALNITPDEHRCLAEQFGEKAWPCADRYEETAGDRPGGQEDKATATVQKIQSPVMARRQRLVELLSSNPKSTMRQLASSLRAEGYEGSSLRSVKLDLDAMGLKTVATEARIKKDQLLGLQASMLGHRRQGLK